MADRYTISKIIVDKGVGTLPAMAYTESIENTTEAKMKELTNTMFAECPIAGNQELTFELWLHRDNGISQLLYSRSSED